MTTQELNNAIQAATDQVNLAKARKAEAILQFEDSIITLHDAQLALDNLLLITPVDPVPPVEVTSFAPIFVKNPDATVTVIGASGFQIEAWSYEAQTDGWVASGTGDISQDYTFTPAFNADKVRARYIKKGTGGEFTFEGETSVFLLN